MVAGSVGYLKATFQFSDDDWSKCTTKIARFWIDGQEHAVRLDRTGKCTIPKEVLTGEVFEVSLIGVAPGYKIETNKTRVRQEVY